MNPDDAQRLREKIAGLNNKSPLLRPVEAHALAAQASAELLSRFHYQNVPLDDAMSSRILDRYLNAGLR